MDDREVESLSGMILNQHRTFCGESSRQTDRRSRTVQQHFCACAHMQVLPCLHSHLLTRYIRSRLLTRAAKLIVTRLP